MSEAPRKTGALLGIMLVAVVLAAGTFAYKWQYRVNRHHTAAAVSHTMSFASTTELKEATLGGVLFMSAQPVDNTALPMGARSVGPGGCSTHDACESYCNSATTAGSCLEFAQGHGIITAKDVLMIEDTVRRVRRGYDTISDSARSCLATKIGLDTIEGIRAGVLVPAPLASARIKKCLETTIQK